MTYDMHPLRMGMIPQANSIWRLRAEDAPPRRPISSPANVAGGEIDSIWYDDPNGACEPWERVLNCYHHLDAICEGLARDPRLLVDASDLGDKIGFLHLEQVTCDDLELPPGYMYFHFGEQEKLRLDGSNHVEGVYVGNLVGRFPGVKLHFVTNHADWDHIFADPFQMTLASAAKMATLKMPIHMPMTQLAISESTGSFFEKTPRAQYHAVRFAMSSIIQHAAAAFPAAERSRDVWDIATTVLNSRPALRRIAEPLGFRP